MVILLLISLISPWKDAEDAFYLREYERAASILEPYIEESGEANFLYILSLLRSENYERIFEKLEMKSPHLLDFELLALLFSTYKLGYGEIFLELLRDEGKRLYYIRDLLLLYGIEILLESGRFEDALKVYRELEEEFPQAEARSRALFLLMDTLKILYPESTVVIIEEALPLLKGEERAQALYNLALLDENRRANLLLEIIKKYPGSPYALDAVREIKVSPLWEGIVLYSNGNYRKAWKSLRRVPWDSSKGSYYKLLTLFRLKRYRDYLYNFEKNRRRIRKKYLPPLLFYAGLSAEYLGRYTSACHYFEELIGLDGRWGERGIYEITLLFVEKRRTKWALARLKETLEKFPPGENPLFDARRGLVSLLMNRTDDARLLFMEALRDSGFVKSLSLYWLFKITGDSSYAYLLKEEYPISYYTLLLFPPESVFEEEKKEDVEIPEDFRLRLVSLLFLGEDQMVYREILPYPEIWSWASEMAKKFGMDHLAIRLHLKIKGGKGDISILFPLPYLPLIEKISKETGLEREILLAISREESWFNGRAVSPKGAMGLMQILPVTAEREAVSLGLNFKEEDLFNPSINLLIGAHYFRKLLDEFESYALALAAYNAGPHRVREWIRRFDPIDETLFIEFIPFGETRNYVRRVLRSYFLYRGILK
jgi:hypothetical protein